MMSVKGRVPSAASKLSEQRLAQFGSSLAAVLGEKEHQLAERVDIGSLDLLPALFLGFYEACLGQHREMGREGALCETRCVNKLTGRQAFGFMPDEQAEGFETRRMGKGGESGKRGVYLHASELFDASCLVNSYREIAMDWSRISLYRSLDKG
jgi:hypothetical protein